jgi:uncharacterized surface protein with fasciclin (FAS1) repeats
MIKRKFFFVTILILLFLLGCQDAVVTNPKYQSPEWLDGKVYDVIEGVSELSTFAECLKKSGIDTIINASGLYTVMAPTNSAFETYFANHSDYSSVDDIDSLTLLKMVKYHIILMPYSKEQLSTLSYSGWIDDDDDSPSYSIFKRQTFYKPSNIEVKVDASDGYVSSISSDGDDVRYLYSEYNKYAPLFYSDHLAYSDILSTDYEYYFDRSFESSEVYFCGAQLLYNTDEDGNTIESYSAENGYVFMVDQVVEPLLSGYEHLYNEDDDRPSYSDFGDLIHEFATLTYNEDATYDQEGAEEGYDVDDLYDLEYPSLEFNVSSEVTYSTYPTYTMSIHNGLFAPTNSAFNSFVSEVLTTKDDDYYWTLAQVPIHIKRMVVNSHMINYSPYYPSQAGSDGDLYDANDNAVDISDIEVTEAMYGSNVTFVGLNQVIMPPLLSSVVGPVMLRQTYNTYYWALYAAGADEILQALNVDYSLFVIPDEILEQDSSLFVYSVNDNYSSDASAYGFWLMDKSEDERYSLSTTSSTDYVSVQGLVYSHIGIGTNNGNCRKEFIRNLIGQYIIFDNENNTVSGEEQSRVGYNGTENITLTLDEKLLEDYGSYGSAPTNGNTYSVDSWMSFSETCISADHIGYAGGNTFVSLMERVGMVEDDELTFLDEGEVFTLFLPTDDALEAAEVDTLSDEDLIELLETHFVLGVNAFTDNYNKNPSSTKYYTMTGDQLSLSSDAPDELNILDNTGEVYYTVEENGDSTNKMYLGWDNGNESDDNTYSNKVLSGTATVIHLIDTVIRPEKVLE